MTSVTATKAPTVHVPRILARERPDPWWDLTGSLLFADVSGFTRLSEHLAGLGKLGAEELTAILTRCFTDLLAVAFTESGDLLSYGGDALLLAFDGDDHADRAARAAIGMREALRDVGRIETPAGRVRLRISQGIHSGSFQMVLAGSRQRELLIIGPDATLVTAMETAASAGEVLVSSSTAELLDPSSIGRPVGEGFLVRRAPAGAQAGVPEAVTIGDGGLDYLPRPVRDRLVSGGLDAEHRFVAVAFLQVTGVDRALVDRGAEGVSGDLTRIVDATEHAAGAHGVCLLASDIAPDGVKLIVTAGAPAAIEDPEGALLAAVRDVVDDDLPLPVRAGAHAGHVFAGEVGSSDRRVYTVIGDAVNLAARLMGKARPGQLIASRHLLDRAGTRYDHQPLEPFLVKGKRHPQQASVVGARIHTEGKARWEDGPFIGRRAELAVLESARDDAWRGHGTVVDITGEPGVGKSRLLHHFLDGLEDTQVIRISSEPYQSTRPYYATRLVLRAVLGIDQDASSTTAGEQLLDRLAVLAPDLLRFAPLLALAIDAEVPPTDDVDDIAPEFRRQRLNELVGRTLGLLGRSVLVFEDANFIDESSRDAFAYALRFIHRGPWLAVLTRRDVEDGLRPDLGFPSRSLELGPLTSDDLRALAREISEHTPLPDDEIDELVSRAAGNPLFLIELVRARLEAGTRRALPTTLEGIIAARLDRLASSDRRILRHAAVLGDRFPPTLATEVLADVVPEIADRRAWRRLDEFVASDQGDLRFRHSLLREVAYEGLPFSRRRTVHRRVAEALERQTGEVDSLRLGLLALHYDLAGVADEAWEHCRRAGERATSDGANAEATTLLERAIDNGRRAQVPTAELAATAELLADAAELAARYDRATAALRLARKLTTDDEDLARLARKEGVVRERTGRYDAALRWYRRGRHHAERLDEPASSFHRADLMLATAGVTMHQGKFASCVRWAEGALEHAIASGNRRAEAHAYYLLDVAHTDLGNHDANSYRGRSLAIFEELDDLAGMARTLGNLSVDARYEGRWDEALDLAGRCSTAQRRLGDVTGLAMSQYNAAEVLQDQGRLDEATEMLVDARRAWRAAGFTLGIGAATGALGRIAVRSGNDRVAVELIDEAITIFTELGADTWVAELRGHRIEADLFAGRFDAVIDAVSTHGDGRLTGQDGALRSKLLRFLGVAQAGRDPALGTETLERAIELAHEAGAPYEEALAKLELAAVETGRSDRLRTEALTTLGALGVTHPERLVPSRREPTPAMR